MLEKFAGKKFFFVSISVVGFVCFHILNWYILHLEFIFIRFFGELLMFPLIFLVQPVLFVLSIVYCINDKFRIKSYSFWSFLILLVSNSFTIGSFIMAK